ncbi:hypothetical protein T484DRAFT_2022374 [Baffinella frigidus]|nr:hypothetical protein T484DRAFT_2022374 [Cryptophyta sp. CCMP2293]
MEARAWGSDLFLREFCGYAGEEGVHQHDPDLLTLHTDAPTVSEQLTHQAENNPYTNRTRQRFTTCAERCFILRLVYPDLAPASANDGASPSATELLSRFNRTLLLFWSTCAGVSSVSGSIASSPHTTTKQHRAGRGRQRGTGCGVYRRHCLKQLRQELSDELVVPLEKRQHPLPRYSEPPTSFARISVGCRLCVAGFVCHL